MKKKSIPPFMLTEGQQGRILFEFTLGDGAEVPELCGALMVHGERVDMVAEDEGTLVIPVLPAGVYLAEVRAGGVCVLYGHVEVLPSPLREADGDAVFRLAVDCTADVLRVGLVLAEGIPGRRGERGLQGAQGAPGEPGLSAYELACQHGYAGSEAEWVAAFEGAQAAVSETRTRAEDAEAAARAADDAREAAEQAKMDAQAAQSTAEEQAAIATAAAEAALAPESIAAQAARPATMVLVKDELLRIVGEPALFTVDTDGQKIIVHTDRLEDEQLASVEDMLGRFVPQFIEVIQYNHHIEVSWRDIDRYADCTNIIELQARAKEYGFTKFGQDLPPSGELCYNLKNVKVIGNDGVEWPYMDNQNLKKVSSDMPLLTNPYFAFRRSGITEYTGNLDGCIGLYFSFTGCTKLSKWRTRLPKLKMYAGVAFFDCILDKQSILIICESIPAYTSGTYELGIGIHADHQTDDEVLAAIANAEAKGWTMTVQWNGTPTSTASTMAMGTLIYAKVGEMERPDGTTEQYLDWGHYVTNWEERGYEQFRSLESAYRYFGLPEDD